MGFTPITPADDSRLVYVSNSTGADTNDCLTAATPCKTIDHARKKMRLGFPDHLYLKRGDVWRDEQIDRIPSGRSNREPSVVAFYGATGARPKLEVSGSSFISRSNPPRFIHVIGLEWLAYKLDPAHPDFSGSGSANIVMINNHQDILFEDNKFGFLEVVSHSHEGSAPKNLTFRRNIWTGYYVTTSSYTQNSRPSNIYAAVPGLQLIENVFDHGGWHATILGAGANMYNHNIYLQAGVDGEHILVKGNIVTRGASHGIQMRSGGLAEDNFFARNSIGLSIGYKDPLMFNGVRAHIINNVISEGHSMVKGLDPCGYANSCSAALWGIDMDLRGGNADWHAHGNIVSLALNDNQWQGKYNSLVKYALGHHTPEKNNILIAGLDHLQINESENIAWQWSSETEGSDTVYPDPNRTLADYNAQLGGAHSFNGFMNIVLTRPLQTWDTRYGAPAINAYIREGFGR